MNFYKPCRCCTPLFRMIGNFILDNVNAGGSAVLTRKNLLPEHPVVTHEITYQGRDHMVKVRSGESVLVVINVHFEPDLSLRNLRERLRRIVFHWPRKPEGFGIIIGDFNVCEHEEGSVMNQTFTEGDVGRTALFRTFFPYALEIAQPNLKRKDAAADGELRTLSRIDFHQGAHGGGTCFPLPLSCV